MPWIALSLARPGEKNDWLSAVASYTSLYTNLTFPPPPDVALATQELALVGGKVGAKLTPETVAPNIFIVHGDVVLGGDRLLAAIATHVRAMVPSRPGTTIEIVAGDAGDGAALLGAAGLVLSELLQFPI